MADYITNIHKLITHPAIQAHIESDIKVLLITPPPIDEWAFDSWDEPGKSARKAGVAKCYAEAVRLVGRDAGVAVADLWSACMAEAGWKDGDGKAKLPGDRTAEKNNELARLLYDGQLP